MFWMATINRRSTQLTRLFNCQVNTLGYPLKRRVGLKLNHKRQQVISSLLIFLTFLSQVALLKQYLKPPPLF